MAAISIRSLWLLVVGSLSPGVASGFLAGCAAASNSLGSTCLMLLTSFESRAGTRPPGASGEDDAIPADRQTPDDLLTRTLVIVYTRPYPVITSHSRESPQREAREVLSR